MSLDVERARAETPGAAEVAHLNNAGAALMPQCVLDAVQDYWAFEARTGGYEAAEARAEQLQGVYASFGRLLNCAPDEIALTDNASRAWAAAFTSLPFSPGDRILTSQAEYVSNYLGFLRMARRSGVQVVPVPNDEHGQIDVEALANSVDERVKLIALTHVPTNGGLVNPAAEVGRVARDAGVPYLLDACQSAGQMPLDVEALGCDMLSGTGRKYLRAPRGTGFLYIRRSLLPKLEPTALDLHSATWTAPDAYELQPDARRFELFEASFACRAGLGAAVDYALDWGLEAIEARVSALAEQLREALGALPGVTLRDLGRKRCGIVTFTVAGHESAAVKAAAREAGININVSAPMAALLDSTARDLPPLVRASVHYYNTEDELERLVQTVRGLVR